MGQTFSDLMSWLPDMSRFLAIQKGLQHPRKIIREADRVGHGASSVRAEVNITHIEIHVCYYVVVNS